ncbi:ribosomal protein subunit L20 [Gigaspora margarita]|uniref:Ribosomal protein subunit L20 n=1 Tax=Gigaspora margarita TaxID=4874 RepID=A0A8H3XEC6_GIGMA|nr:ribosomal protein subunit L20 [Gigaspora margarita]
MLSNKMLFTKLGKTKLYCGNIIFFKCQIINRSYTARKPIKPSKLHAPIYSETILDDGSKFMSRVSLDKPTITMDKLPPPLKSPKENNHRKLTEDEINEMRELRLSNPEKWTCNELAKKFQCSPLFVGQAAPLSKERREILETRKIAQFNHMGWKKRFVRSERARRRANW